MSEREDQDVNDALARNIRTLREAADMSQEKLGEAMQARGHAWTQSTINKVEASGRLVKFAEALALSQVFGVPLDRLAAESETVSEVMSFRRHMVNLARMDAHLMELARTSDNVREALREHAGLDGELAPFTAMLDKAELRNAERATSVSLRAAIAEALP